MIKKILSIIVVSLLMTVNSYANNNLKGIKSFSLIVNHIGECGNQNFKNELTTIAKYVLGNTKININKGFVGGAEHLRITVQTAASTEICASHYILEAYHFGTIENSAGYKKTAGTITSYSDSGVQLSGPVTDHKKHILEQVELLLKTFVVAWVEDQN